MRLNNITETPSFAGIYHLQIPPKANITRAKVTKMLRSMDEENYTKFLFQKPEISDDVFVKLPDKKYDRKFAQFIVDHAPSFSIKYYSSDEGLDALNSIEAIEAYVQKSDNTAVKGNKGLKKFFRITDYKDRIAKQVMRDEAQIPNILEAVKFNAPQEYTKEKSGVVVVKDMYNQLLISPENKNGFRYVCKRPIQSMTDAKSDYFLVTRNQDVIQIDALDFFGKFKEATDHFRSITKPISGN